MDTIDVSPEKEVSSLQRQANSFTAEVGALAIQDATDYEMAAEMARDVALFIKRVGEVMDPICKATDEAHKVAVRQRDQLLKPAQDAKRAIGVRMAEWDEQQARARREAEEAAERERLELERKAREEAEAAQRALQAEAEERRLAEAEALEKKGDKAGAARLIAEPVAVPVVTPAPVFVPAPLPAAAPKVDGISHSTVWDFAITDAAKLPREFLVPDLVKIRGVVRAMKEQTNIPGVKVVPRRNTAVRA